MPEHSPYREPARPSPLLRSALERIDPHRRASLVGSLAALAGAGALAATQLELLAILGAGALATATHAWRENRERRRREALASFLGSAEVVLGPSSWTSPDGCRRVRSVARDSLLRFEHLDPASDETLASFSVSAPVGPCAAPFEVLERRVAPLHGRGRGPRCFAGLPPELGGEAVALTGARYAMLERARDGVLLVRCDASGARLADTLHADVAAALRQLEAEHGEHVGRFRDAGARFPPPARTRPSWVGEAPSRLTI